MLEKFFGRSAPKEKNNDEENRELESFAGEQLAREAGNNKDAKIHFQKQGFKGGDKVAVVFADGPVPCTIMKDGFFVDDLSLSKNGRFKMTVKIDSDDMEQSVNQKDIDEGVVYKIK